MTEASMEALRILRSPDHFQWYVLFGLGLVVFVYINEIQNRNWDAVLLGLLFSAGEFIWEIINGLILHFTGYSALWTTPDNTAYLILVGLNIEIFLLFSLAGVGLVKLHQTFEKEPDTKILGFSCRWFIPLVLGLFCVFVECALNYFNILIWTYKYWNWPQIWSIIINYMTPFFLLTWAHFHISRKGKVQWFFALLAMNIIMWVVFVNVLHWI